MKKSAMILGLMMMSTIIFAQRKMDPMERSAKQADKMKTELALDEVQYKAVKAINEEFSSNQSKLRSDSTLTKEARHKKMRTLHQEKEAAIGKVLTEEQKTKWASHRSAQASKHKAGKRGERADRSKRMQEGLSLSDEQTAKIKAIDMEFAQKFRTLRSDSTLAKEDSHEKAKLLRQEYLSKTKSVLTEEQFKKWEAQKAEHKRRKL